MTATVGTYQESPNQYFNQSLFDESATQKHRLGTIRQLDDGRRFVYCQATAAQLAAGITVSTAFLPQACTVAAADVAYGDGTVVGSKYFSLTLTGTPTENLYRDGFLVVTLNEGAGEMYKIRGNSADDDPATGRMKVYLYDALATLWVAASTTVDIFKNPYKDVLITPACATGGAQTSAEFIRGVTTRIITASYYFWAQTWGPCSLMMDYDSAAGAESNEMLIQQGTTEGRGYIVHDTHVPGQQIIGTTMEQADGDDAEAALVFLTIS